MNLGIIVFKYYVRYFRVLYDRYLGLMLFSKIYFRYFELGILVMTDVGLPGGACPDYWQTSSVTEMLENLRWRLLDQRRIAL